MPRAVSTIFLRFLFLVACLLGLQACSGRGPDVQAVKRQVEGLIGASRDQTHPVGYLQSTKGLRGYQPTALDLEITRAVSAGQEPAALVEALGLLEQAQAVAPDDPELSVLRGITLASWAFSSPGDDPYATGDVVDGPVPGVLVGRFEASQAAFRRATELEPAGKDGWWGLVVGLSRPYFHEPGRDPADYTRWRETCRSLLAVDPGNIQAWYDVVRFSTLLGEPDAADAAFEQLVASQDEGIKHPLVVRAQYDRGKHAWKSGDLERAEALLSASVTYLESDRAPSEDYYFEGCTYMALGQLYRSTGRKEESIIALEEYARNEPFDHVPGSLGEALDSFEAGDFDTAAELVGRLHAFVDVPSALAKMGEANARRVRVAWAVVLMMEGDAAGSQAELDALGPSDTVFPGRAMVRGHLALLDKDLEGALQHLEAAKLALDSAPHTRDSARYLRFVGTTVELGLAWQASNAQDYEQALLVYDRVLSRSRNHVLGLVGKLNTLVALRRLDEAAALADSTRATYPDDPYLLAARATVALAREDLEGAERDFERAGASDRTGFTCPYEGLGLLYLRQGKQEEAKQALETAVRLNPGIDHQKYDGLARIYIDEGRHEEARAMIARSLENRPEGDEALQLLEELERRAAAAGP